MSLFNVNSLKKAKLKYSSSFFLFLIFVFSLVTCSRSPSLSVVSVQGRTMGTTFSVKLVGHESELPSSEDLLSWANTRFEAINQSMSTYIADSELSLINASKNAQWQTVSGDLFYVLSVSQKVSQLSGGAFDITVGPLVNLWGFGPKAQQQKIPSQSDIDGVKANIGFSQLKLNPDVKAIRKPVGLGLDLSAVAKGFAADSLASLLLDKGFSSFMVEVGGELKLLGLNQRGKVWTIGIETPNYDLFTSKNTPVRAVKLSGKGMATSGDYRNYYEENGVRYSHTIDPLTGRPITHQLASVTVIANECAEADALATALNVLGPQKALETAESIGLAVYLIIRNGNAFDVQYSSAFEEYLISE